jgi:hypothetical protein
VETANVVCVSSSHARCVGARPSGIRDWGDKMRLGGTDLFGVCNEMERWRGGCSGLVLWVSIVHKYSVAVV